MSSQPILTSLIMPDFISGGHAFRHDLHSALACLARLQVPVSRIHIQPIGWHSVPTGTIVGQAPAAGQPLEGDIHLQIAGAAFHHSLPVAMWDSGGEAEPGTREMLEALDDPLEKLGHWMYEGASLLRLSPDNLAACARWINLFGLAPEDWPRSLWYKLALLLLDLPAVAGSEEAVRIAFERVLNLQVRATAFRRSLAVLKHPTKTRLGTRASRLALDFIVGDAFHDMAHLRAEIGPVSLATYEKFVNGDGAKLLERVLSLVLPVHMDYELRWIVLDPEQAPRLGFAEHNCRLNINSYLGSARTQRDLTL
ncbi:MAG TPA: type VI secretion system baseplate subunit TssG [Pseudacidobacterium sp.]|jgi:hypothetical protein|nr:type VI secretion system baseplate subunit TssG [Pseudacidobacterium sp.]